MGHDQAAVEAGADAETAEAAEGATSIDAPDGDAAPDEGSPGCEDGCHWDCSGGFQCWTDGHVWRIGAGAYPCCHAGDPWPYDGPTCSAGDRYTCMAGCGTSMWSVDERYAYCFQWPPLQSLSQPGPSVLRLLCSEGQPHSAGDPCTADDECRPAAASVAGGLSCDTASGHCVDRVRPPAPSDFGASCGLAPADVPYDSYDHVVPGKTCSDCYVFNNGTCLEQACTMPCEYDEDCPDGAVCLCGTTGNGAFAQFCANATDRTGPGRRSWLSCP